jgi:23S rRNA pseudouridine2605 synthase
MKERIQKLLSQRGVASRRQAEQMVLQGRVTCNGAVCAVGQSVDPEIDVIQVDGIPLPSPQQHVYIMLHKPKGYVTTLSDEKGRKNAAQLVADCGQRVYPVGRLDMDSEGLLLFTNDGEFANKMMHPSHEIDKTYRVEVKGYTPENYTSLKEPIFLDRRRILPPELQLLSCEDDIATMLITIHEGRNRQVRRMCARAGMQVKRLQRIKEGQLELGDLPIGKWRYLTEQEREMIYL